MAIQNGQYSATTLPKGLTYIFTSTVRFPSSCRAASHPRRTSHRTQTRLLPFHRFQTMTTSTSNSQPTTASTTIYALIGRRCGGREGDHRAERDDSQTRAWGDDDAGVYTGKSVSRCLCSVTDPPKA